MKNVLSFKILLILGSLFLFTNWAPTDCFCGSHSEGITSYTVVGTDCCKSQPTEVAYEYTYAQQTNGVWEHTGTTVITGSDASDECCRED